MANFHEFQDQGALIDTLSERIANQLKRDVDTRGHASLVVPGGSTPQPLFEALCHKRIPWDHIKITLSDERWVSASDGQSNERLIRETLLQGYASSAHFLPVKTPAATPEDGQEQYETILRKTFPLPATVTLLGMGNDAHCASLFPDASGIHEAMSQSNARLCMPIHSATAGCPRMTLTANFLLKTQQLFLYIKGQDKLSTYQNASESDDVLRTPITRFLDQNEVPMDIYWHP